MNCIQNLSILIEETKKTGGEICSKVREGFMWLRGTLAMIVSSSLMWAGQMSNERTDVCLSRAYPHFTNNPCLTRHMKRTMARYLLPLDHPTKPILDEIFSRYSVINNADTMRKAGFRILHSQKKSFIRVVSHKRLKGYLLKVYLDSERRIPKGDPGWKRLVFRCIVAEKIQRVIKQHSIRNFVVADKWIYPLPPPKHHRGAKQPVVLIVKDMNIYNGDQSRDAWKNKSNRRTLKELYTIFSRGYGSTYLAGNLPYKRKRKFAFIDTEFDKRKLSLRALQRYFPSKLHGYWSGLVRRGSTKYVKHGLFQPAPLRFVNVEDDSAILGCPPSSEAPRVCWYPEMLFDHNHGNSVGGL